MYSCDAKLILSCFVPPVLPCSRCNSRSPFCRSSVRNTWTRPHL